MFHYLFNQKIYKGYIPHINKMVRKKETKKEYTTIEVKKTTRDKLKNLLRFPHLSYDSLINKLLGRKK